LLDIALDELSLGRAAHLEALATGSGDFSAAVAYLDQAVEGLKKAGHMHAPSPLGLLARAALYRDMKRYDQAQADLAEVLEIADPEMRLHLADYHLESARLCLAMGGKHSQKPKPLRASQKAGR
jgi:tetratricopeptide (TPR) repeat protein